MDKIIEINGTAVNDSTLNELEKKTKGRVEKVAVHSTKNLFKYGIGELKIGYNIIPKEHQEFWLAHKAVRSATPEEVAKEYSK